MVAMDMPNYLSGTVVNLYVVLWCPATSILLLATKQSYYKIMFQLHNLHTHCKWHHVKLNSLHHCINATDVIILNLSVPFLCLFSSPNFENSFTDSTQYFFYYKTNLRGS